MEKDNEFIENLQNSVADGVLDSRTELEKKRNEIQQAIEAMEANPIKDPRALETLKKELATVDKKIKKEQAEKAVENGDVVGEAASEKDTDESVKKADAKAGPESGQEPLTEEEKDKEAKLKQAYHDAMIVLHEKRMQTIARQKEAHELLASQEAYEYELRLEAQMYEARNAYLELGKEDPFTSKRTEFIKLEKDAREPIEMELRNRAKRFREIEEEIQKIDKRESEINAELMSSDINETQIAALQKEMRELGDRRQKLEVELAEIKDNLDNVMETRRQRVMQRAGLEEQHVATLSEQDKKNYDYQQSKIATMNKNFDQATKQHYQNIKRRIEEREQKIKDINKELRNVPATDFERRLTLLNELDKETHMLEADREAKSDLDRGIVPDKAEMAKDAKEKADNEAYRQKEFDKDTKEARIVAEEQKEQIGAAVVENPEVANVEERDRDTTLQAAAVAVAIDGPEPGQDTPLDDAVQFTVSKCVIEGLDDKVRDPNNPEDAKAIVANDEEIRANAELERVEQSIEEKTQ